MPKSLLFLSVFCAFGAFACEDDPEPAPEDSGEEDTAPDVAEDTPPDVAEDTPEPPACEGIAVVSFETSDGVTLSADLHIAAAEGPVVALFHMIPPGNDRSNYSATTIAALTSRGLNVLNVDRRGAGASTGEAGEAYEGPGGALDVAAATLFLRGHPCAFDLDRLVLVGASNGTTSVFDYIVSASDERSLPRVAAAVWLTPGGYTEAQSSIEDKSGLLTMPLLFVWTEEEAPADRFIAPLREGAPRTWEFQEYTPGAHGTRMFTASETALDGVVGWIAAAVE